MKIALYETNDSKRERILLKSLQNTSHDITYSSTYQRADLHVVLGVASVGIVDILRNERADYVYFDKGYNRDWPTWWRVACNDSQPTDYVYKMDAPHDRAEVQHWFSAMKPWRGDDGGYILIAGMSAEYSRFVGIVDSSEWTADVVERIRGRTARRILYRPHPSWLEAMPVQGAGFSHKCAKTLADITGASLIVTYGSNCSFDAHLEGIPTIALGNAVLRPISSRSIDDIDNPRRATERDRCRLLAGLAYCQWSQRELSEDSTWECIMQQVEMSRK